MKPLSLGGAYHLGCKQRGEVAPDTIKNKERDGENPETFFVDNLSGSPLMLMHPSLNVFFQVKANYFAQVSLSRFLC